MAAAAVVIAAMIAHMAGIVGVTRTRQILGSGVVLGMLVAVADDGTERRPGGSAFKQAGQDLRLIRLLPGGWTGAFPGCTAGHFCGDLRKIQLYTGRHILQHHTNGRAVGLAKIV